jgi:mRNA interferase HigB
MRRIITEKRLAQYAEKFPRAKASLAHWKKTVLASPWQKTADVKSSFGDVDTVKVNSGQTVFVFNIQRNAHHLIAAIHFDRDTVYVLRLLTHKEYDKYLWKNQL